MKAPSLTKIFLILVFCTVHTVLAKEVKLVSFTGGAPLDSYNPSITVPLLAEAFKRNGIKFYAEYQPSLRSLKLSNSGVFDGELHRVHNFHIVSKAKYPNLLRIESLLLSVWLAAFSTRPLKISSWKDLQGLKVAYYRGRKNITNNLDQVLMPNNIVRVQDDQHAFMLLATNRVDVVITTSIQGRKITENTAVFAKIIEIGKLEQSKIFAYMHHKHKLLAEKIAATIEQMKADGAFKRIVSENRSLWLQK